MNTNPWTCEHSNYPSHPCQVCWEEQVLKERSALITLSLQIAANRKVPAGVKREIGYILSTFKFPV